MSKRISVREWLAAYDRGEWKAKDINTQKDAGWWDWFCYDNALPAKTEKFGQYVKGVVATGAIDIDNWYVWFNNCPLNGTRCDIIHFNRISDHKTMLSITLASGHKVDKGRVDIWDFRSGETTYSWCHSVGSFFDILYYLGNNR